MQWSEGPPPGVRAVQEEVEAGPRQQYKKGGSLCLYSSESHFAIGAQSPPNDCGHCNNETNESLHGKSAMLGSCIFGRMAMLPRFLPHCLQLQVGSIQSMNPIVNIPVRIGRTTRFIITSSPASPAMARLSWRDPAGMVMAHAAGPLFGVFDRLVS